MFEILGLLVLVIPFAYLFKVVLGHESRVTCLETKIEIPWEVAKMYLSHPVTILHVNGLIQSSEPIASNKKTWTQKDRVSHDLSHFIKFENTEYHTTTAKTRAKKLRLLSEGWEFVCQDITDSLMYFRKRK